MATDVLREAKKKVIPLSSADPAISADTCRIVERSMAYDARSRYASYDELIANLSTALSHLKSGRAESTGSAAKRRAGKKQREQRTIAMGVGAVLVAAAAAIWLVRLGVSVVRRIWQALFGPREIDPKERLRIAMVRAHSRSSPLLLFTRKQTPSRP